MICLTPENLEAPWVLFEAGALSKRLHRAFVCPYLFDVEPQNLKGPLVQFQAARSNRADSLQLLHTMRRALKAKSLSEKQLDTAFDTWWPVLEKKLIGIHRRNATQSPQRSDREILEERLELARTQVRQGLGVVASPRREGDPVSWPRLLKLIEAGPRLLREYARQRMQSLKDSGQPQPATVITAIEKNARKIDLEWHQLIWKSAALHRRLELVTSQELEDVQATLMYMAERGDDNNFVILRHLSTARSFTSKTIHRLLETAKNDIIKRSG